MNGRKKSTPLGIGRRHPALPEVPEVAQGRIGSLGPKTSALLRSVGIHALSGLEQTGAVAAYLRLKETYSGVTLNALWGIQAAIMEIDWRDLPADIKNQLREAVKR